MYDCKLSIFIDHLTALKSCTTLIFQIFPDTAYSFHIESIPQSFRPYLQRSIHPHHFKGINATDILIDHRHRPTSRRSIFVLKPPPTKQQITTHLPPTPTSKMPSKAGLAAANDKFLLAIIESLGSITGIKR